MGWRLKNSPALWRGQVLYGQTLYSSYMKLVHEAECILSNDMLTPK